MRKPSRIAVTTVAVISLTAAVMVSDVSRSAASDPRSNAATISDSGSLWRQTDANPALSRDNPNERVLTATTIGKARLLRTFQPLLSAPVNDEFCSFPGPDGAAASPLFEPGGRLFVGTQNSVTEYNPANGVVKDQIALGPEQNRYLSIARGVLVADGTNCDSASDPSGYVEAHDAMTGTIGWEGNPASDDNEGVASLDLVQDGARVYAGFANLSAVDVATGTTLWQQGDCGTYGQPFVAGGLVIASDCRAGASLSGLDPDTGVIVWTRAADLVPIRANATGGHAEFFVQRLDNHFAALSAATGATLFNLPGANGVLAADRSRVYASCGQAQSDVCAYSTKHGALLWHAKETDDQTRQTDGYLPLVAVGANVVYVGNGDVLNAVTGKSIVHLWRTGTATALAVGDGYLAADIGDGALRLYGLPG